MSDLDRNEVGMFKRIVAPFFILIICVSLVGCAALQRKFVRRKKKQEIPTPVITTFDYSKELRVDELYKRHFLFWKTWHLELMERMDATYKKRLDCYDNTLIELGEFRKYLPDPKAGELDVIIKEIKGIGPDIKKRRLSRSTKYRMTKLLERTFRRIVKRFSYPKVKGRLELKK